MPINEQGYLRPTYDEILESRIALAQELFGQDIDTSDATALGKFIRLSVQDLADALEVQEILYYSRFPKTATGQNLDRLMPFAGITRNPPTRAEHKIEFTGTANHEIEVGFLVGTTGDETFYVVNPITLDESGKGTGIVQCTELGTVGNVRLGEITEIVNPDVNVLAIKHLDIELIAEDAESDVNLRKRFDDAIEGSGSSTAAAIRGAVMRVNGVTCCLIAQNEENVEDASGRPPHSFEVYVRFPESLGLELEVAKAIFEKKPLGIKSVGDVAVQVDDASGGTQTIYFSLVDETPIYIKLKVATDNSFGHDGVAQIKTALMAYIGGLNASEDVIYTSLYRHIFGVAGVKDVTELGICTDGASYASGNITVGQSQIATISAENITVEVVSYEDN